MKHQKNQAYDLLTNPYLEMQNQEHQAYDL